MTDPTQRRCNWCGQTNAEHGQAGSSSLGGAADRPCLKPDGVPVGSQLWIPRLVFEPWDRLEIIAESGVRGVLVDPGLLALVIRTLDKVEAERDKLLAELKLQHIDALRVELEWMRGDRAELKAQRQALFTALRSAQIWMEQAQFSNQAKWDVQQQVAAALKAMEGMTT